ncbi:hypothetical protein OCF63_13310 [Bacillus wiedmannii]|uniref:hypothetical protein n=1 Tax=Bacillus cereus group TaxID=86661 RepID=UPI000BF82056|nr:MULTISPECIES: hypothetical protein [Bacillus cereus group]MCU5498973.1 hypothetical protein [Bacillus wiedmannii]PFZ04025.1 hypothetical protein COL75_11240 [Bacillus wiedmannii]QWH81409.1 hypothetical protein EXW59_28025 [Bacillus mycoides]QWI46826.1 hypothetical protein EXW55_21520 [Bacillus mycoides]
MMNEDKVTLVMIAVLTVALIFVGISYKFNSLVVDIITVLFLLISTAIGAAILTEGRRRKKSETCEDFTRRKRK